MSQVIKCDICLLNITDDKENENIDSETATAMSDMLGEPIEDSCVKCWDALKGVFQASVAAIRKGPQHV